MPYSENLSIKCSSSASSCTLVTRMIHPSTAAKAARQHKGAAAVQCRPRAEKRTANRTRYCQRREPSPGREVGARRTRTPLWSSGCTTSLLLVVLDSAGVALKPPSLLLVLRASRSRLQPFGEVGCPLFLRGEHAVVRLVQIDGVGHPGGITTLAPVLRWLQRVSPAPSGRRNGTQRRATTGTPCETLLPQ